MGKEGYPAIAVLGPTGSGKTRLSISLALQFGGEIVSCDALQVYRGMDIGTAKPTAAEREAVPHHMLDLCAVDQAFSAGDYQDRGRTVLAGIRSRGRVPIVTGGTGLYFRALTCGLFEGPGRAEEIRQRLRRVVDRGGVGRLRRALQRADPDAAGRIAPADTDRIVRAYEVFLSTGRPISWWQARPTPILEGFRWLKLGIDWPRDSLYARINLRAEEMFREGFVTEVEDLLRRYPPDCQAFKAIGYRQVAAYLRGTMALADAVSEMQRESRRYAKRQLTWFRSEPELRWLKAEDGEEHLLQEALPLARDFLQSC